MSQKRNIYRFYKHPFHYIHDKTMEIAIEQFQIFNPFLTYVPLTDKPYSWFLPAKCMKNIVEEWHFN